MRRERVWLDPLEGLLQRRGNGLPRMRATRRLECRERAYQVRRGCANPLLGRLTSSGGGCLIPACYSPAASVYALRGMHKARDPGLPRRRTARATAAKQWRRVSSSAFCCLIAQPSARSPPCRARRLRPCRTHTGAKKVNFLSRRNEAKKKKKMFSNLSLGGR